FCIAATRKISSISGRSSCSMLRRFFIVRLGSQFRNHGFDRTQSFHRVRSSEIESRKKPNDGSRGRNRQDTRLVQTVHDLQSWRFLRAAETWRVSAKFQANHQSKA